MPKLIAQLELPVRPDKVDEAPAILSKILAETRAFAGCEEVLVVTDTSAPSTFLAIETWESAEADAKYRQWRAGEGAAGLAPLGDLLAGPPVLRTFSATEI